MRAFRAVLEFELLNYLKSKSYMIITIVLGVLLFGSTFLAYLPAIQHSLSPLEETGAEAPGDDTVETGDSDTTSNQKEVEGFLGIYAEEVSLDYDLLGMYYPEYEIEKFDSEDALVKAVEAEEVVCGFAVEELTDYKYYVWNSDLFDNNDAIFANYLLTCNQKAYCESKGIDYEEFAANYQQEPEGETVVLGKDSGQNYWYCYALIILVFMMIVMYGNMIATSVTAEKSNRAMEVLITSTDSSNLLFGKVLAGAIAAIVQVAIFLIALLGGYQLNSRAWKHVLDPFLQIPAEVILMFVIFGIGGFVFYAFIFGAMGALVSKTEEVQKAASGVQMVIIAVYMVSLFSLANVDSLVYRIFSYLPISSYSIMFARVAMGNINAFEIVISAIILYASVFLVGFLGAKIYRMGTLHYGNPMKIKDVWKALKLEKQ